MLMRTIRGAENRAQEEMGHMKRARWIGIHGLIMPSLGMAVVAVLMAGSAAQAGVDIGVNQTFTGSAPGSSPTPLVNYLFSDIGNNTVQLTITAPNLTGPEFLDTARLNFNPTKNVSALTFTPVFSLWQGVGRNWDYATGEDKFKATQTGGRYDINLAFNGNSFVQGDQAVFDISTSQKNTSLSSLDFAFLSTSLGAGTAVYYAAASIGAIGPSDIADGWAGATTFTVTSVPEPASGFPTAVYCLAALASLGLGRGQACRRG